MKKGEIEGFIEDGFKRIVKHFHKAIVDFGAEDIRQFRTEIKKLKVFLHLLCMESDEGFTYRITKRMKTIYGYFGVIQNLQQQLKKTNEYLQKYPGKIPVHYLTMLERELQFREKVSRDFIDEGYDFLNDKKEILSVIPGKLTQESIRKFIHYTLFELQSISGNSDDYSLDSARKFMEDIYYNYAFFKPFITENPPGLFNEKVIGECLGVFYDFRDKCKELALVQTFNAEELDGPEKQLLKEMENDWLFEKNELKKQLTAKLDSMDIKVNQLREYAFTDSIDE